MAMDLARGRPIMAFQAASRVIACSVVISLHGASLARANSPAPAGSAEFVETPVGDPPSASFPPSFFSPTPAIPGAAMQAPGVVATTGIGNPLGFLATASRSSSLLGEMWGLRPWLSKYGMTFNLGETSEILGNVTGGARQGFEYDGLTTATLQLDTQRAFGLNGGLFNVSALQIHGRNLSADNLNTLQTASGIEADRATRLWELWYQQKFGDDLDVKIGQQSLDQEFMVSQNASYFVNTMFGWPMLPSADLPGGGPAYPLSDLGPRVRGHIGGNLTYLVGLFSGNPAPTNVGDPQVANPNGVSFPLNGGALAIAELQFMYPGSGYVVNAGEPEPLERAYKIGFWYDTASVADLRYNDLGQPLGNPANAQTPRMHSGDYAFYAVADQMIWRASDADHNLDIFLRPMFTPLRDRNLISFSLNAGLVMHEPFPGRDDDTAGLGLGIARVGGGAAGSDRDAADFDPGTYTPVRSSETFLEATYQYQVAPWWQIQPDVQYVFNPGAGLANPNDPSRRIKDELVIGVRTNITF